MLSPSRFSSELRYASFLLPFLLSFCLSYPDHLSCSTSHNYTADGKFKKNLEEVLISLATMTPSTGVGISAAGVGRNRVFGTALCRGDASYEDCGTCIAKATYDAFDLCPGSVSIRLWYNFCFIRYSNRRFFGTLDDQGAFMNCSMEMAVDWESFGGRLDFLTANLSAVAATRKRMFATGEINLAYGSSSVNEYKIYGLVQCVTDLSAVDCKTCLARLRSRTLAYCAGHKAGRGATGSCMLLYDTELFFRVSPTKLTASLSMVSYSSWSPTLEFQERASEPPPLPPPPPPPSGEENHKQLVIALSTAVPLVALLPIVGVFVFAIKRRERSRRIAKRRHENLANDNTSAREYCPQERTAPASGFASNGSTEFRETEETMEASSPDVQDLDIRVYDWESIMVATNGFSDQNILGEGGNGRVFKGNLCGMDVAVKRLWTATERKAEEFMNEVRLVANLRHRNLVQLLGCCSQQNEKILVYEYVPNASLDKILFDRNSPVVLNWSSRLKIINGVARGLLYLHEECRLAIVHKDLKASNVLLEMDMTPKIADFGLVRTFEANQTHASTMRLYGTLGYMPPEFFLRGHFSPKYDVFSFGVLLLEIVSGLQNQPGKQNLIEYASKLWRDERSLELMDRTLSISDQQIPEVLRCIHIGLLCVQDDAKDRPSMSTVVMFLGSDMMLPFPSLSSLFM